MIKKTFLDDESIATLNPNMKVYKNPFPRKMADTIKFIEENGLPDNVKRVKKSKKKYKKDKKSSLSALQNELLTVFAIDPSEKQMQELKNFLHQLFGHQIIQSTSKVEQQEEELVA